MFGRFAAKDQHTPHCKLMGTSCAESSSRALLEFIKNEKMIELFTIFGKDAINELITSVLLQERNVASFSHDGVTVKYKLDNELDIVILVVYQSIDLYKNVLADESFLLRGPVTFKGFSAEFDDILSKIRWQPFVRNLLSLVHSRKVIREEKEAKRTEANKQKPAENIHHLLNQLHTALQKKKGGKVSKNKESSEAPAPTKKGKQARKWDCQQFGKNLDENGEEIKRDVHNFYDQNIEYVGKLQGDLPGLDEGEEDEKIYDEDDEEEDESKLSKQSQVPRLAGFSAFKSLVGNKQLTQEDLEPVLEKMKETLISKNVAAEPAIKFSQCVSLGAASYPKRRVDILRDIMDAKNQKRPYVIVFCGVNGVGKSTNLARHFSIQITFWLNENNHRVLIVAGDTFRAGL
uniref:SRP54-type proteins GTP-binding domain-containing protein n=1 Tax=Ditylenchus dipsaci TaxID=166011 RepID=A0A915DCD5_9BILA